MRASEVSGDVITVSDDNVIFDVANRRFRSVKASLRSGSARDLFVFPSGCHDVVIEHIEGDTWLADGFKVQNAGTPARNVQVLGGYIRGHAAAAGVHQDGVQQMGGSDFTFRNVAFDHVGGGGGNLFIAQGGSGVTTPMNARFDRCAFGPSHPNQCRFPSGSGHVMTNCLVYRPYSGRAPISGNVTQTGTVLKDPVGIVQAWADCLAYIGAEVPPPPEEPPPPPPPPPPDDPCADIRAQLETAQSARLAAEQEAARLQAAITAAKLREDELDALLASAAAIDVI